MVTDRQVDAVRDIFIFIELENTKEGRNDKDSYTQ